MNPSTKEAEASLVYVANSMLARATQSDPISRQKICREGKELPKVQQRPIRRLRGQIYFAAMLLSK